MMDRQEWGCQSNTLARGRRSCLRPGCGSGRTLLGFKRQRWERKREPDRVVTGQGFVGNNHGKAGGSDAT